VKRRGKTMKKTCWEKNAKSSVSIENYNGDKSTQIKNIKALIENKDE
jgi:hypothetical protein